MKYFLSIVVAAALVCVAFGQTELNIPDNLGRKFEVSFAANLVNERYVLNIASLFNTTATITVHQTGEVRNVTIVAGTAVTTTFPTSPLLAQDNNNVVEVKGITVESSKEVSLAGGSVAAHSTDGFTAIPVETLSTEYWVITHGTGVTNRDGWVQVTAAEDGTIATVTLSQSVVGRAANTPFNVSLNAHESIAFHQTADGDLSGTHVVSNKNVAVFAGHTCANIPNNNIFACDHINNMMPPASSLAKEFLLTPFATRTGGDTFRVVASEDNTAITQDGTLLITLNKGEVHLFDSTSTNYPIIAADKPVLVAQFMKGTTQDGVNSDPAMSVITPISQWSNDFIFSPLYPLASSASHWVNIAVKAGDESGVEVDGVAVPSGSWVSSNNGAYRIAQVQVTEASHHVRHVQPNVGIFTMAYGFASADSYAFPGGFRLAELVGCVPTAGFPGDGIDNDCDGRVDEELPNGIDDDGDGAIDEDLAKPIINDPDSCLNVTASLPVVNGQTYTGSNPNGKCVCLNWN